MSLQPAHDVALHIISENATSERRISPSWTVAHLKGRLEPITGIPSSAQRLILRLPSRQEIVIEDVREESMQLARFPLQAYAEIHVSDLRPAAARTINLSDPGSVPKYTMPADTYNALPDSVLAWKKANRLGRFDPDAPEIERKKIEAGSKEVEERDISMGKRCRLGAEDARRGRVAYVGEVPEIPGLKGPWVGVVLDEPLGKNDGSTGGTRYFDCEDKYGVFVRPDRVDIGEWGILMEEMENEDMEEI